MLKENFISHAEDEESNAKVSLIDNNKSIICDQYTSDAEVGNPELFEGGDTIKDVFDHFKPNVEVSFTDEEGGSVNETLHFNSIKDFEANGGRGNLVSNSAFLSDIKMKADINTKVRKQIEQNKKLRDILKDEKSRDEFKAMIEIMLEELNNSK
ncbi:hypothetical protein LJC68_00220 [Bacteroidales bacterium OttesenSCG-928-B11]|nr:hypothetical protein [Bacteroidales bacterium OttesenSCG-928-E04]MDL2308425.1 hypothetical protein [Bacteroidales bacterium OttesenSCG-928-C03]MDL2311289.1 hypothetical protein [Bacteroidales bacterium OttesenSCG-928-B11]MDL2326411.1 hypothetical protein [Bacteroidales bacterium OttesenSCG-928-A14]